MFDIPTPGIHQRKRIIDADFNQLCTRTGIEVKTAQDDVMMLAERIDFDFRNVTRLVRDSFIEARSGIKITWPPFLCRQL